MSTKKELNPRTSPLNSKTFAHSRFHLDVCLKENPGSETWIGLDRLTNSKVILKFISSELIAPEQIKQIEYENQILRQLSPHLTSNLLESGFQNGLNYLVLNFLPGVSLKERLFNGALSIQDTTTLALSILETLQQAHAHGILHNNIKPSNIILQTSSGFLNGTLVDFGMNRIQLPGDLSTQMPVESVQYMSPEQAGTLDRKPGSYSDLYSLGCVLYECLAGSPLIQGAEVGEILRKHLVDQPLSLRVKNQGFPNALDVFIQLLLKKDPSDRYTSAKEAMRDLANINHAFSMGDMNPSLSVGLGSPRLKLLDARFVGRTYEISLLNQEFKQTQNGQGKLILLEAESGVGKSRLIQEFIPQHSWILRGIATSQAAQRPFQILSEVVHDVLSRARREPKFKEKMTNSLEPYAEVLCDILPELSELFNLKKLRMLGPETLAETRTIQALSAFLNHLGSAEKPVLLTLDDFQWADDLSLRLVQYWQKELSESRSHPAYLMMIVSFRTEEVSSQNRLRHLKNDKLIRLEPFGSQSVRELAESMAGVLPPEAIEVVTHLSQGNPFMVSAVMQGLIEAGALIPDLQCWKVDLTALGEVSASRKAGLFLAKRLKDFPEPVLELLTLGALIGKIFSLNLVSLLSKRTLQDTIKNLQIASERKVIWINSDQNECTFVHDKIRETLLELIPLEKRGFFHLKIAREVQKLDPSRIYDLAFHFSKAGCLEEALPFAIEGAVKARKQHVLEISERYFRIAEKGSTFADDSQKLQIFEGLGDVLMLLGRYDDSQISLLKSQTYSHEPKILARIQAKLGELAFKKGDVQTAAAHIEEAVTSLGRWVPKNKVAYSMALGWEILIQALHTCFPRLYLNRLPLAQAEDDLMAAQMYSRLAYIYWFGKGKIPCGWAHLKEMNLAEKYPPTLELAQAYSEHAPVMTMVPWFKRGVQYVEKSLKIRKDLGEIWGQGQSLHFYGIVLYASSRFEECLDKCLQAIQLLERTGDHWEINTASWHIAFAYFRLGKLKEAYEWSRKTYFAGIRIGDHQAAGISLASWTKATSGRVPREYILAEMNRGVGDVHTQVEIAQANAVYLLEKGEPAQAVKCLEESQKLVKKTGLRQEYVAPVLPWLATALRKQISAISVYKNQEKNRMIRKWKKTVRQAVRISEVYQNNLPQAYREKAYLCAFQGKVKSAESYFEKSRKSAIQQKARLEEALTLIARGEIATQLGWKEAQQSLSEGTELYSKLQLALEQVLNVNEKLKPQEFSFSLADRFSGLLRAGHQIASALTKEELYRAIRQACLSLLRGEKCSLIESDKNLFAITDLSEVNADLLQFAIRSRKPVILEDLQPSGLSDQTIRADSQSAICAPILAEDEVKVCFYVTHQGLSHLFGEEEKRVAEFISTLAGAALENTWGFEKIRVLLDEKQKLHEKAETAVHARDEFLSIASHELKTPLTSLMLYSQMIAKITKTNGVFAIPKVQLEKYLSMVDRQVRHLMHLIEDLLDVSRLATGHFALNPETVNVNQLIDEVVERLHFDLKQAECSIQVKYPEKPLLASLDRTRFEQALVNIITNATKYARGSPIEISLKEFRSNAYLSISDTGPGIPIEKQKSIFQRFERAVSSRSISGLGLGLFIAFEIMKAHHGQIDLESVPGVGSTFTLKFPI